MSNPMEESIHDAVYSGEIQRVRNVLKRNANCVNDLNADFKSPLHVIYDSIQPYGKVHQADSRLPVIKKLIKCGADVNIRCAKDKIPLFYAIEKHQINGVKIFLENGADLDVRDDVNCTALMNAVIIGCNYARDDKIIRLLLNYKADLNLNDNYGSTVLDYAILYNRFDYVQTLLDSGARMKNIYRSLRDKLKISILELSENELKVLIVLLLSHTDQLINICQFSILHLKDFCHIPLKDIFQHERISTLLKSLQNYGLIVDFNFPDYYNLHQAVREGTITYIKDLLRREETDVNLKNFLGDTPLHLMIHMKETKFFEEIGRHLLDAGANWRAPNIVDETPFYLAVNNKAATLVKLMLSRIARVDDSMLECDATKLPTLGILYTENDAALHELLVAICVDCESAVDRLINEDYNIDEISKRHRQDITIALVKAIELNKYNTVKILLESGFRTDGRFNGDFKALDIIKDDKIAVSCLLWEFNDRSTLNKMLNTVVKNAYNSNLDDNALLYLLLFYYRIDNYIKHAVPDLSILNAPLTSRSILSSVFNKCKTDLSETKNFKFAGILGINVITMELDLFVKFLNRKELFDYCREVVMELENLSELEYFDVAIQIRLKLAIEKKLALQKSE